MTRKYLRVTWDSAVDFPKGSIKFVCITTYWEISFADTTSKERIS